MVAQAPCCSRFCSPAALLLDNELLISNSHGMHKACGCGLSYDVAAWSALPLVGVQRDEVEALEMRNCACGSTLAVSLCIVEGCTKHATWAADNLLDYCDEHAREWLMSEESIGRRDVEAA